MTYLEKLVRVHGYVVDAQRVLDVVGVCVILAEVDELAVHGGQICDDVALLPLLDELWWMEMYDTC